MKKFVRLFLAAMLVAGCTGLDPFSNEGQQQHGTDDFDDGGGSDGDTSADTTIKEYDGELAGDIASDSVGSDPDIYWELGTFGTNVVVTYSGTSATVETANANVKYLIDGGHVVVDLQTNAVSGVNIIAKGTSSNGSLKIYSANKFKLTLSGLDLTSSKGPAINDQCKKRVFVHLTEGTTNRLTDCAEYGTDIYSASDDEDRKGCFFSEGDMIISGSGSLVVSGLYKHGICTDGSFYMRPGATVVVSQSVKNAINASGDTDDNTGVTVTGGLIYASATGTAGKAISSDLDVLISGGKFNLYTSGGATYDTSDNDTSSASCIKSDKNITITAGTFVCKSTGTAGKGIKADGNIVIGKSDGTGPTMTITTTGSTYSYNGTKAGPGGNPGGNQPGGNQPGGTTSGITSKAKAVKAEGTITFNGGDINVYTATSGSEGIESKTKGANSIVFNGGNIYVEAYDDAVNSAGQIIFNNANVFAYSTGNDAIDSNYGISNSIVFNGGFTAAQGVKSPEEGIDADNMRYVTIKGGTIFSSGGVQNTSSSPSCSVPVVLLSNYSLSKGYFVVTDSNSKVVMSCYVPRTMTQCYSYIAADFASNTSYKYGILGSMPSGYTPTTSWNSYYYYGGTASVTNSFTTSTGFSNIK